MFVSKEHICFMFVINAYWYKLEQINVSVVATKGKEVFQREPN